LSSAQSEPVTIDATRSESQGRICEPGRAISHHVRLMRSRRDAARDGFKANDARRQPAIRFRALLLPEKVTARLTSSVRRDKLPQGQRARAFSVNFPYHNARDRVCS